MLKPRGTKNSVNLSIRQFFRKLSIPKKRKHQNSRHILRKITRQICLFHRNWHGYPCFRGNRIYICQGLISIAATRLLFSRSWPGGMDPLFRDPEWRRRVDLWLQKSFGREMRSHSRGPCKEDYSQKNIAARYSGSNSQSWLWERLELPTERVWLALQMQRRIRTESNRFGCGSQLWFVKVLLWYRKNAEFDYDFVNKEDIRIQYHENMLKILFKEDDSSKSFGQIRDIDGTVYNAT